MRTIWKFPLVITDSQYLALPQGARVLAVAYQGQQLCLWAEVNPDVPLTDNRLIRIFGTGHSMPAGNIGRFIGTVLDPQRPLVWHVYSYPE